MEYSLNLWTLLTHLVGGVGLFLLGMTMMTDGLKLAAGPALERILASAITVATICFVNAGLLSLGSAL